MSKAVIYVNGAIELNAFEKMQNDLAAFKNYTEIELNIDSFGGYIIPAMNMYSFLKMEAKKGIKVTTIGWSMIFSSATLLFVAGSERILFPFSRFLIHYPRAGNLDGATYIQLQNYIKDMGEDVKNVVNIYKQVTGQSETALLAYMGEDKYWYAEKALETGFATKIDSSVLEPTNKIEMKPAVLMYEYNVSKSPLIEEKLRDNVGFSRAEMPQIEKSWELPIINYFLVKYGKRSMKAGKIPLSELKATQNEILDSKVNEKKLSGTWGARNYLIGNDNRLIDGHHDWAAGLSINPENEVNYIQIKKPIRELISELNALKVTYSEGLETDANLNPKMFLEPIVNHYKSNPFEMKIIEIRKPTLQDKAIHGVMSVTKNGYSIANYMSEKALKHFKAGELQSFAKNVSYPVNGGDLVIFVYSEDGALIGNRVVVADASGNPSEQPVPNGTYEISDSNGMKTEITIVDGIITEAEVVAEMSATTEKESEMENNTMLKAVNDLVGLVKTMKADFEATKAELNELKKDIPKMAQAINGVGSFMKELKSDFTVEDSNEFDFSEIEGTETPINLGFLAEITDENVKKYL